MKPSRQKWFRLRYKLPIESIIKKFQTLRYTINNQIGFDLNEISKEYIKARYIERQQISEQVLDPFGNAEILERVQYTIFVFEFTQSKEGNAFIKIVNPPVSLKQFVKLLEQVFGDYFSISKVNIDTEHMFHYLCNNDFIDRYTIPQLNVGSIPFTEKATASFRLKSPENAYDEFLKHYCNKKYKIEKVSINARINGNWENASLSSSGTISCTNGFNSLISTYIHQEIKEKTSI